MALSRRVLLASSLLPGTAVSASLAPEVTGAINTPTPRRLHLADLDALGTDELVTQTPWTHGTQRFGGLLLRRLLDAVGAHGGTLRAVALNDYAVTMPIAATILDGGFLATRQNGAPLPVRERGPFWIVFPWSQRPELDTAQHRQRAIWQLRRIEVS